MGLNKFCRLNHRIAGCSNLFNYNGIIYPSCIQKKEGILIHNQASDEELHNFERIINQLTEKSQMSARNLDSISPLEASKTDLPARTSVPQCQPSTSRSHSGNKRKWGSQRSRSGRGTHRSSD